MGPFFWFVDKLDFDEGVGSDLGFNYFEFEHSLFTLMDEARASVLFFFYFVSWGAGWFVFS